MSDIGHSTVSIRLHASDLDPTKISHYLNCPPTASGKQGEVVINADGRKRVLKKGFWRLEYGESDQVELEKKIDTLLNQLTDDLEIWQEITAHIQSDLFCGIFLEEWNEGFELFPGLMRKLADRNLKIGFDIFSPTDTWYEKDDGFEDQEDEA